MSLMTFITVCLSCSMLGLIAVAIMAFREVLRCGKDRSEQQAQIIALLAKIEDIQRDNMKNYADLTLKVNSSIVEVGVIVHDLHRYFEFNALTRKDSPLEQEEDIV